VNELILGFADEVLWSEKSWVKDELLFVGKLTKAEWETGPKQRFQTHAHRDEQYNPFINTEDLMPSRYALGISPGSSKNDWEEVAFFPLEPENVDNTNTIFKKNPIDWGDNAIGKCNRRARPNNFDEDPYDANLVLGANAMEQQRHDDPFLGLSSNMIKFFNLPLDRNGLPYPANERQEDQEWPDSPPPALP
jgi:hypothetical protein